MKHTLEELKTRQAYPLDLKIALTKQRVRDWINEYGTDGVYISFSGGKDSTVLMDIIRNDMGYNLPAVFVDVPTQYPELKQFALQWDNVEVLKPKISLMEVCEKYGFPLISKEVAGKVNEARKKENGYAWKALNGSKKGSPYDISQWKYLINAPFEIHNYCCDTLKKKPIKNLEKKYNLKGITATMAEESKVRTTQWLENGCNAFHKKRPISNPMSFWTEQDILQYIKTRNIPICSVYGDIVTDFDEMGEMQGQMFLFETGAEPLKTTGCKRTGCMLCGFGCHFKDDTRFLQLKETHPKMYNLLDVVKNNGVTFRQAIEWINENGNLNIKL